MKGSPCRRIQVSGPGTATRHCHGAFYAVEQRSGGKVEMLESVSSSTSPYHLHSHLAYPFGVDVPFVVAADPSPDCRRLAGSLFSCTMIVSQFTTSLSASAICDPSGQAQDSQHTSKPACEKLRFLSAASTGFAAAFAATFFFALVGRTSPSMKTSAGKLKLSCQRGTS